VVWHVWGENNDDVAWEGRVEWTTTRFRRHEHRQVIVEWSKQDGDEDKGRFRGAKVTSRQGEIMAGVSGWHGRDGDARTQGLQLASLRMCR
jgi:hypothetical protein